MIPAAATDHRIKAVATVSAADIGRQFHEDADGSQDPAIVQGMLDAAGAAPTAEARGEGVGTFQSSCTGTRARATSTSTTRSSTSAPQWRSWAAFLAERFAAHSAA